MLVVLAAADLARPVLPARAEDGAAFDACVDRSGGVASKMLDCGKEEIARQDARLNAAYRALIERSRPDQRERLRREQRLWLARHLAETARLAADPNDGSAAFLKSQAFELDDLAKRTLELEERVRRSR